MELKSYQKEVIADLARYLELVVELQSPAKAYQSLWNEKNVLVGFGGMPNYVNVLPGVPHVCAKVPTGGGKTYIAASSLRTIFDAMPQRRAKAVVWLVPSEAILTQTRKALENPDHPYRQRLDVDFGGRVQVYSKEQALMGQNFTPSFLCLCSAMIPSAPAKRRGAKPIRRTVIWPSLQSGWMIRPFCWPTPMRRR